MKFKPLLFLVFVLGACCADYCRAGNGGTNTQSGQIYRDETHCFQITLPKGWMAKKVDHTHSDYGYAFLTINNQRRDLDCGDGLWAESGWNFHGHKTELQSNEVYMCIGYDGGPFGTTMVTDTVDHDLGSLLATNPMHLFSENGEAFHTWTFFKRGQECSISVSMKEPVSGQNRQGVMSILQSFRFLDGPVCNASWAEALAWNKLPAGERMPGYVFGWPAVSVYESQEGTAMRGDSQFAVVKKIASGYLVKFTRGKYLSRSWEFNVFPDGRVVQGPSQRMYHWKFIWEHAGIWALVLAAVVSLFFLERAVRIQKTK